jgi:hypothetical protein
MSFRISVLSFLLMVTQMAIELQAQELIVSDRIGNRVLSFNPVTGAYVRTIVSSVFKPTSVALIPGPSGLELLVSSTEGGFVRRYSYESTFGSPSTLVNTFANGGYGDILYHQPTNRVLLADFGGTGIRRYLTTAELITNPDMSTTQVGADGGYGGGVGAFSGLDIDNSGNLLVSSYTGGVFKFDPNAGTQIGASSIVSYTGLGFGTAGIKSLPDGSFLTSNDYLSGPQQQIVRYDSAGGLLSAPFIPMFNPANPTAGGTAYTNGMTILNNKLMVANQGNNNPGDTYFTTNLFNGSVGQYTLTGAFESNFITMPDAFGPTDFAISPIPEPGTWGVLVLAATGGMMYYRRRRQTAI